MISNISKYSNNPNNSKYLPQKTIYRKQFFNLNQSDSYKELNINKNDNNKENSVYFDKEYNFYQNEKEHIEKVKEKILQLKMEKMNKMSKECTFSPEINKNSKYIQLNKLTYNRNNNDTSDEFNISNLNYFTYTNGPHNHNYFKSNYDLRNKNSISTNKNKKINEESVDDFYNIYPKRSNNEKQRYHTYSGIKNNKRTRGDYSIYQKRKEELPKLFIEQHPFMPNIKYNKNYPVNTTFSERQNQFIINKKKLNILKEIEETKMMEEMQKRNHSYKIKTEEVIKRLYDKEAIKIKDKLKKEKEEKSKIKKIIDWKKKNKKNKEKYLNDLKNKIVHRNHQIDKSNSINNNSHVDYYRNDKNGNQNFIHYNNDEINNNGELLKYKFNNEDLIEFRNINNQNDESKNNYIE